MKNQIQGFFPAGRPGAVSVPAQTPENYAKWFAAYQAYIAERSVYFQSLGIDVWEVGCSVCMFHDYGDGTQSAADLFHSEYVKALDTMKRHFTGKVLMSVPSWLPGKPDLASRIDIFEIGFWGPQPSFASLNDNLTVGAYRTAVANSFLQAAINQVDSYGKSIMISYGIQSRRSMFIRPGYVEETACTAAFDSFAISGQGACMQREEVPDFSMQAIVHAATLEAINQLSTPRSTLIVNINDYWLTDSLMPYTAFPNLAFSVRNKPAEGVIKAWFAR
jgi:hypothetical protein